MKLEDFKEKARDITLVVGNPQYTMSQKLNIPKGTKIDDVLKGHLFFFSPYDMVVNTVMLNHSGNIVMFLEVPDIELKKNSVLEVEWHLILNKDSLIGFTISIDPKPIKDII